MTAAEAAAGEDTLVTPKAVKPVFERKFHPRFNPNDLVIVAALPGNDVVADEDDDFEDDDVEDNHGPCVDVLMIDPKPKTNS